jgi:hypothetical protein
MEDVVIFKVIPEKLFIRCERFGGMAVSTIGVKVVA